MGSTSYFAKQGCTFHEHKTINNGLRYRDHVNGSRLTIKYLSERKWTKTLRDTIVHKPDEDDDGTTIGELYIEMCQKEAARYSNEQPMWIANNDLRSDDFDGVRLSNVPHGMNNLQEHTVCCVKSALNPVQSHRAFLQEMCGMTEREVRRALLSQAAYQALGRGCLRDPDHDGHFLLIVPDRETAEDISIYYPGCQVESLLTDYAMPNAPGRPPEFETDELREAAKRGQARERMRRYRNNVTQYALYKENSVTSAPLPSDSGKNRAEMLVQLDAIAEASKASNIGGFAYSDWASKKDGVGLGHVIFATTAEFVAELRRHQATCFAKKASNTLFSPTIFDRSLFSQHTRAKENALIVRGVVLDIENCDMTPVDFVQKRARWSETSSNTDWRRMVSAGRMLQAGSTGSIQESCTRRACSTGRVRRNMRFSPIFAIIVYRSNRPTGFVSAQMS